MSLPPEVRANYISIVDAILAESDLSRISEKKIRQGIQDKVEYDITPQKAAIKGLILERFDIFDARQRQAEDKVERATAEGPPTNGYHTSSRPSPSPNKSPAKREAPSELETNGNPEGSPKKKPKESLDADAAFAARLQAEEDKCARPTRGGSNRKAAPAKKKSPKKKTALRIQGSDESDVAAESSTEKKAKNTGFNKPMNLSSALSALLDGEAALSRPQCVKRIWQHIRANELQDPEDKRQIICDEPMRKVFKQDRIHMFTMNKVLNQNLYPIDD